ncbi:MAG TPA: hypothetical protein VLB46_11620 [Pyrinomonadaceae bacterium]|nr:hypothetical protein [Pyrinomonadaceae bacterium]
MSTHLVCRPSDHINLARYSGGSDLIARLKLNQFYVQNRSLKNPFVMRYEKQYSSNDIEVTDLDWRLRYKFLANLIQIPITAAITTTAANAIAMRR